MDQISATKEVKGKKPIALAVCLVLLTITTTLTIMFSTQYIGAKQAQKADAGEDILNSFEKTDIKIEQLNMFITDAIAYSQSEASSARVTANNSLIILLDLQHEIDFLLQQGIAIDESKFSERAIAKQYVLLQKLEEQLTAIGTGSGQLSAEENLFLQSAEEHMQSLSSIVNQFNFVMKGNRNAMIRLAGGFEWIELGVELDQYINNRI